MIDFHFCPTPNCWKVAILLQELELAHRIFPYDIYKGDHLSSAYRKINPNAKLPAIVDHDPADACGPLAVFESAAILIYLAEKTGHFLPAAPRMRTEALQWTVWQVAGVGPMFGQASHFIRYAPEDQRYSAARYRAEANRLARVMDDRLSRSDYLAGAYSIADIAAWPWFGNGALVGIDLNQLPDIQRWLARIGERPAVQRVFNNPATSADARYLLPKMNLTSDEWSNLFDSDRS